MTDSNSASVEAMIKNVVTVVFRIHFYYVTNYDLEQDLKQEGYLKAYELLAQGNYDPNKNLRTFIYTGVRNAMTNYMYHHKKESHEALETITSQTWQGYEKVTLDGFWKGKIYNEDTEDDVDYKIDLAIVYEVCSKYQVFGDYLNTILYELKNLGLYSGKIEQSNIIEIPLIKEAILGEIFWKMFRK